ncbi:MAG: hypothetical protein K0R53_2198 [Burkholderiales bacterium]|nr:hypothetical protein [Burkholderiales bacterium]
MRAESSAKPKALTYDARECCHQTTQITRAVLMPCSEKGNPVVLGQHVDDCAAGVTQKDTRRSTRSPDVFFGKFTYETVKALVELGVVYCLALERS